jgi:hypothetical protein
MTKEVTVIAGLTRNLLYGRAVSEVAGQARNDGSAPARFVPRNGGRLSLIGKALARFRNYGKRSNPEHQPTTLSPPQTAFPPQGKTFPP